MPSLTQNPTLGDVIKEEFSREICREVVTLNAGNLKLGTLLGRIEVDTTAANTTTAPGTNTGNGTIAKAGTPILAGASAGVYTVVFTAPTAFNVLDPSGRVIGAGATGVAFARQIAFTITAGGTPFVAGDSFTVTVPVGSLRVVTLPATAQADGSGTVYGVLCADTDASAAPVATVALVRGPAILSTNQIIWPSGLNTAALRAPALAVLAAKGVIARTTA